jgi:hypothetical protein
LENAVVALPSFRVLRGRVFLSTVHVMRPLRDEKFKNRALHTNLEGIL